MRLILIRHGQTQSNVDHLLDTGHPGAPFTERGHVQAASLVERLADEPIEVLYSSDLTRARQTAEPLAQSKGLTVVEHPGLREIYAGVDDMSPDWMPYVTILDTWHTNPENALEGGENWPQLQERFEAAVSEIRATGARGRGPGQPRRRAPLLDPVRGGQRTSRRCSPLAPRQHRLRDPRGRR